MEKLRLYLDTTILNFLFADDSPEECRLTQKFFKQIKSFEVSISEVVLREVYRCEQPKQKKLLDVIDRYDLEVFNFTEEADQLAEIYIKKGIIPVKYRDDANHIAVASLNNCDVLSWNFQHIVKIKTKREVSVINLHKGYNAIDIYTPREVIEDV